MTNLRLTDYTNDVVALLVVALLFVGYHIFLQRLIRRNSVAVLASAAKLAREAWVETVMADHSDSILAVQTLRNSTMAASFLASTAVLLMVGALTLTGQAHSLGQTWRSLNIVGTVAPELWLVKLLCILLLLFFSFFNFINSIRVTNHVGYMIAIQKAPGRTHFTPEMVASELNHGSEFFSIGLRSFYHLVPLVFWLFGPLYMIAVTVILVFFLLPKIDRTPFQFVQSE